MGSHPLSIYAQHGSFVTPRRQWRAVAVAVMTVAVAVLVLVVVQSWGVLGCSLLSGGWVSWGCHGVDVGSRSFSFHVLSATLLV